MSRTSIILALSLALISCGNKNSVPSGILKPARMQEVLWDIILADAFTTQHTRSTAPSIAEAENAKLQKQVFAIHDITREDFYKSFDYYKEHTNLMKPLLDSIINKAEREKNKNVIINPALTK